MKVLYIVTAYPRAADDVITPWLVELIRRLRGADVDVEVLAPSYGGLRSQVVDGVTVHRFRYAPARWERLTHEQTAPDRIRERPAYLGLVPSYVLAGSAAAARLARSGGFDAVHAFWPLPHGVIGLAARAAGRIPLVTTFFGVELTWLRSDFPALRPVLRAIVRRSDAVTAISSYTASLLRAHVPTAAPVVIPFGAAVEGAPVERRPLTGDRPFSLLFVGRLVERKGIAVLVDAVRRLVPERGVELRIVGDGPLRPSLERQVQALGLEGVVRFEGAIPGDALAARLAACDALVLPAVVDAKGDTEGLGVVLLEALAHGRPVIASDVGGIPDIVRDRATGLLVPPADADALARAIATYMDDPALAAAHAATGAAHVRDHFSWEAIVSRLAALYREVVGEGRGALAARRRAVASGRAGR